jgi:hypothetical protein
MSRLLLHVCPVCWQARVDIALLLIMDIHSSNITRTRRTGVLVLENYNCFFIIVASILVCVMVHVRNQMSK